MYLVIDRGNSRTKIALFGEVEGFEMKVLESVSGDELNRQIEALGSGLEETGIRSGIFSSVVDDNEELICILRQRFPLLIMTNRCALPVKNLYGTPESLGNDRIAAAVAASGLYPGNNLLAIDAGTCITYDFINKEREYLGGGIAPGLRMRFKALHTFTGKLPLVSLDEEVELIGTSTVSSIRSGVFHGIIAEIDGIIDKYRRNYPDLKTILTGGDAIYFDGKLKNNIFAVPNLVLLGLKDILLYNVEK